MNQTKDQSAQDFDEFEAYADDSSESQFEFDLQHYLRTLRKHKWPIFLFTAAVTALAAYHAQTSTPIYRSTSTLLIESETKGPLSIEGWVGIDTEAADYYQTQFELLKSRELALRVVRHMDLVNHPDFFPNSQTAEGELDPSTLSANDLTDTPEETSEDGFLSTMLVRASELLNIDSLREAGGVPSSDSDPSAAQLSQDDLLPQDILLPQEDETGQVTPLQLLENKAASRFLSRLTVVPVRKTKLVKISFESPDAAFAARVANVVGEQYIYAGLDAKMELSNKVSTWTNQQLSSLKRKLDESEARVIQFKQDNGLVDVNGSVRRLNEQEMAIYTQELAAARSELSNAADLQREIGSFGDDTRLLETLPAVQADPVVRDAKLDIGQARRELDELLNRYGVKHPRVIDAQSRLDSLQATMDANVVRVVDSLEKDYNLLRQRVSSIQSKINQGKSDIQALSAKTFELEDLEREVESNRSVYEQFFNRMTEANSADGLETANARIADYAIAATSPFKPKKELIIALAALGALALSMLMAFLYEQMDNTVKSTRDVESRLRMRMLGLTPLLRTSFMKRKQDVPLNPVEVNDSKGTFFESINTIRTALVMGEKSREGEATVNVITSSVPGEGKSTTSMNIAYSFSQIEKVLLIDADLRRPTIAKALGREKSTPGLTNLITRQGNARDCVLRNAIGEMDVICSGPLPDQPLELLASPRFELLIAQLKQYYDRIIIDCAPTQAVSDPLVLSKLADSVIYCIKSAITPLEIAQRGLERLRQVNANMAGVVMTQVDMEKMASYGGDHYYQGYYDYYGYSDDSAGSESRMRLTANELERINERQNDNFQYEFGLNTLNRGVATSYDSNDQFDSELESTLAISGDMSGREAGGPRQGSRRGVKRVDLDII